MTPVSPVDQMTSQVDHLFIREINSAHLLIIKRSDVILAEKLTRQKDRSYREHFIYTILPGELLVEYLFKYSTKSDCWHEFRIGIQSKPIRTIPNHLDISMSKPMQNKPNQSEKKYRGNLIQDLKTNKEK